MGKALAWLAALAFSWLADLKEPDPPIEDALRFPPAEVVEPTLELAIAHMDHLRARPRDSYHDLRDWNWLCEAARCREAWKILWEVQCLEVGGRLEGNGALPRPPRNSEKCRREKLRELRDLIGRENYHRGRMPPPVPLWRFVELR